LLVTLCSTDKTVRQATSGEKGGHQLFADAPKLNAKQLGHAPKIRRRYKTVEVATVPDGGYTVSLDNKPMKTPKGQAFILPSKVLAEMVAAEFQEQKEHIIPDNMPMMTLTCTALDVVGQDPNACITRLLPYLETDAICFINDADTSNSWDRALGKEQDIIWTPVREWFSENYGKVGVTTGIRPPDHPPETIEKVQTFLQSKDIWQLAAIEVSTRYAKSLICAIKYIEDTVTTDEVMKWANLEEDFQISRCGLVEGDHDVTKSDMLKWLTAVKQFSNELKSCS